MQGTLPIEQGEENWSGYQFDQIAKIIITSWPFGYDQVQIAKIRGRGARRKQQLKITS